MEIQTRTRIREWGNSLGIVIPKEIVVREELEPEDRVIVTIEKEKSLKDIFGKLKNWKIDSQKFKDEIRKEEAKDELFS